MKTSDFAYDLPPESIAQTPVEPRDAARLLVLDRATGALAHHHFRDLPNFLHPGDLLVANQTRVIPARLWGRKIPTGGRLQVLLLRRHDERTWEALVGAQGMGEGKRLRLDAGPEGTILAAYESGRRLIAFSDPLEPLLDQGGQMPLPPYIHTPLQDPSRYQTVYARESGSAAAPTAGLHFTPALLEALAARGAGFAPVTLHIGLDTFAPVHEADPRKHLIHTEWCAVPPETAEAVRAARRAGRRVIAVGTTSVRALESAAARAAPGEVVAPFAAPTGLYILPGFRFRVVDALITNFHLPKSTLLMMISAFAGRERVLEAYEEAKTHGYRFYSFGDAMLIHGANPPPGKV